MDRREPCVVPSRQQKRTITLYQQQTWSLPNGPWGFFFPTTDPTKPWGQGLRRTKTDRISLYLYLGTQFLSHPACDSWDSGVAWEFKGFKWWVWAGFMLYRCFRHGWIWWLPLCFKGFVGEVNKYLSYHREFTFKKGLVGVGLQKETWNC